MEERETDRERQAQRQREGGRGEERSGEVEEGKGGGGRGEERSNITEKVRRDRYKGLEGYSARQVIGGDIKALQWRGGN